MQQFPYSPPLYGEVLSVSQPELHDNSPSGLSVHNVALKFGLRTPNLAPDIELEAQIPIVTPIVTVTATENENSLEPRKKKYAKEAWPGKKPTHALLM